MNIYFVTEKVILNVFQESISGVNLGKMKELQFYDVKATLSLHKMTDATNLLFPRETVA